MVKLSIADAGSIEGAARIGSSASQLTPLRGFGNGSDGKSGGAGVGRGNRGDSLDKTVSLLDCHLLTFHDSNHLSYYPHEDIQVRKVLPNAIAYSTFDY